MVRIGKGIEIKWRWLKEKYFYDPLYVPVDTVIYANRGGV